MAGDTQEETLTDVFDDGAQSGTTTEAPTSTDPAAPAPAPETTTVAEPAGGTPAPTGVSFPAPTAATIPDPASTEIQMPAEWAGRGAPPRPETVRDEIASNQHRAQTLRQHAQQISEQEQRVDADANLASQLLAERTQDYKELEDRANALSARSQEVEHDLDRLAPDLNNALDHANMLKRALGERVPSDELRDPSGTPPPVVAVETDPTKIATLRQELSTAQADVDKALQAQSGLQEQLTRIKAEDGDLRPQLELARTTLVAETTRTEELKTRGAQLDQQSGTTLDQARALEAEAKNLSDALPDYETIWQQYAADHPDEAQRTDLGTIDVRVPPRETAAAHAQGRREEAGRLEQQAADLDEAAADAARGIQMRGDLAQRRDEEAADLTQRADQAAPRVTSAQAQADTAREQVTRLAADTDRMTAEADRLRAAGRTEAADTMQARAHTATNELINASTRADRLAADAERISQTARTDSARAAELTKEAETLRNDAATLGGRQTELANQATKLRADATTQDEMARRVEDQLDTGQPFQYTVTKPDGTTVEVEVPSTAPAGTSTDLTASDDVTGASPPTGTPTDSAGTDDSPSADGTASADGASETPTDVVGTGAQAVAGDSGTTFADSGTSASDDATPSGSDFLDTAQSDTQQPDLTEPTGTISETDFGSSAPPDVGTSSTTTDDGGMDP
ncbi:MAG: hypothetical protein WD271_07925 [Acidimicrobiia bacterium]